MYWEKQAKEKEKIKGPTPTDNRSRQEQSSIMQREINLCLSPAFSNPRSRSTLVVGE